MTQEPKKTAGQKKSAARRAEAEDGFVVVEHGGLELRIPIAGKVPLTALIAFQAGEELKGTQLLLGQEQWDAFLATNPTLDDFAEIGKQLEEASGN